MTPCEIGLRAGCAAPLPVPAFEHPAARDVPRTTAANALSCIPCLQFVSEAAMESALRRAWSSVSPSSVVEMMTWVSASAFTRPVPVLIG